MVSLLEKLGPMPSFHDHSPEMKYALRLARMQKPELDWNGIIRRSDQIYFLKEIIPPEDFIILQMQNNEIERKQQEWCDAMILYVHEEMREKILREHCFDSKYLLRREIGQK